MKTTKPNVQNKKKHDIPFVIQNTSHPKYIKQKQKSNNILKNKKKQNKTKCIPNIYTLTFLYSNRLVNLQKEKNEKLIGRNIKTPQDPTEDISNQQNTNELGTAEILSSPNNTQLHVNQQSNNEHNNNESSNNEQIKVNVIQQKQIKKPIKKKRNLYRIFRDARVYLESNNIMLSDFLEFNPFHPKPLHIQYSAEFLDAVKFGKHEIV